MFAGGLWKTKKCFELKSLTVITVNQMLVMTFLIKVFKF